MKKIIDENLNNDSDNFLSESNINIYDFPYNTSEYSESYIIRPNFCSKFHIFEGFE